jgi:hypothetical protein
VLRTVTFSDAKIAEFVNANFISAWFNRSPGFRNDDDRAEKSIFEHSTEAFPTKNICTFILTPDGRVFHYLAGYAAPEPFLKFLEEALALRRAGFDDRMALKPDGLEALRKIHAATAAAHEAESKNAAVPLDAPQRTYRGITHRHSAACSENLRNLSSYLARVHRAWEKSSALPSLDEIRYKYLYGDPFSEEGPGAHPIAVDPTLKVFG